MDKPQRNDWLAATLREAAWRSGKSGYRLAKDCGVHVAVVQQWLAGGGLRTTTASRLCEVLGLELVEKRG